MTHLLASVVAFVLGYITAIVTLHFASRDRKPKGRTAWREVAEREVRR